MTRIPRGFAARAGRGLLAALLGVAGLAMPARAANPGASSVKVQVVNPARIAVRKLQVPPGPVVGGPLTYQVVVSNTGTSAIANLLVVDTVTPILAGATFDQPAGMPVPVVASVAGSGTRYVWSGTGLSFGPGSDWTFTVSGTTGIVGIPTQVGNTAYIQAATIAGATSMTAAVPGFLLSPPVSLAAAVSMGGTTLSIGQVFSVMLTVTNTGAGAAAGVTATLWRASGPGAATFGLPAPPVVASLAAGANATFTWTLTAAGAGAVGWTGSASGGGAVSAAASPPVAAMIQTPPSLSAAIAVAPAGVCSGQPFDVTVTLANAGQAAATGVTVLPWTASGTGAAAFAAGPAALAVNLAGGTSTTFTWTYNASGAGGVAFAMTVTGADANSGLPVAGPRRVSPTVTVSNSAVLASALWVQPAVSVGQAFTVRLTVTNTGGVPASGVTAALDINAGPGSLVSSSGGSPTIAPGGGVLFSWTINATGTGTIAFTATATGTSCGSFSVSGSDSITTAASSSPMIASVIQVSPTTFVQGQVFVVTMTVSNTGGGLMTNVIPSIAPTSGPVTLNSGPLLPNGTPVSGTGTTLSGPGMITFTWSFTAASAGSIAFTGGVTATDPNTGASVTSPPPATPPPVVVETPALLAPAFFLTPGVQAKVGNAVVATLNVQNAGQDDLRVDTITRGLSDPGGLFAPVPTPTFPALPQTVQGNTTLTFTWTYTAVNCGPLAAVMSSRIFATDLGLSRTMTSALLQAPGITVANSATGMVVSLLASSVKVAGIANMTVSVYDSCVPSVGVANEVVTVSVVSGGGQVVYLSGPTDASGMMRAVVLTGNVPGQNAYLVADPNLPGTTVFVTGTVPDVPTPFLSKNFFNPKAGEKLQVRSIEPSPVHLSVRVYNLAGELVKVVREADVQPGLTVWEWDGTNQSGARVGNGTYFIQVVSGRNTQIKRVIVLSQ